MSNHTREPQIPEDEEFRVVVERVRPLVLAHARGERTTTRRARLLHLLGFGLLVFGGGLALGAAAAFPAAHVNRAALTIDCFAASGALSTTIEYGTNDNGSNPVQVNATRANTLCGTNSSSADDMTTLNNIVRDQFAAGHTCGTIDAFGQVWTFIRAESAPGHAAWTLTDGAVSEMPSGCVSVQPAIPPVSASSSAICEVAPDHIAVYTIRGTTTKDDCASRGLTDWSSR